MTTPAPDLVFSALFAAPLPCLGCGEATPVRFVPMAGEAEYRPSGAP